MEDRAGESISIDITHRKQTNHINETIVSSIREEMEDTNRSEARAHGGECISIDITHSNETHHTGETHHTSETLVSYIKEKMEDLSSIAFIYKVPEEIRQGKESRYTPNKISIGPSHYKDPVLKTLEDHKWMYLNALVSRKPKPKPEAGWDNKAVQARALNPEENLVVCVKALKEMEHRARKCYKENIDLTSDQFVQMMLVDGCFIIELFLRYSIKALRRPNDPIFATPNFLSELRCDFILLENQIPLFVLHDLFKAVPIPEQCTQTFNELAFRFFTNILPGDRQVVKEKFCQEGYHLLDLIRHCMLPTFPKELPIKREPPPKQLESATKLRKWGIKFKSARAKSLLDVKFANGVLAIPLLKYHSCLEKLLWNLIVFERLHFDDTQYITSYAFLMGCLINAHNDVKLLGQQEILSNFKEKKDEIANLFGKIKEEVRVKDSYYLRLYEQVNDYRRIPRVGWKKSQRDQVVQPSSPKWYIIAILLLLLTFVGTFFSVLSFCLHL
ncbi:UPF0481 protein At3g47200 [Ziziphus jujuba]|uniref:UPF0481 protein At3g47200 n=1 Tax=Ziziphus jujuba TaxID=326968 RepID=A0A6P3ZU05_ZIZJJ|nr:UPF0481 protein At3g47200 [Ziziphus jujuba]